MNRWVRLSAAVVAMIMNSNFQYAWTLFVEPLRASTGWKLSEVQWGFTLFIALGTWVMPASGWLIDRLGPRVFMSLAGVLCGVGWAGMGYTRTLTELYVLYSITGVGSALVYCGAISVALKWFPDKRGLASGLIAAGFGSGAAVFIPIIAYIIRTDNFRSAFLYSGIAQGFIILCAAQFLQNPPSLFPATVVQIRKGIPGHEFNSWQMLRTPQFYVLFVMMLLMGIGGLMATAQVGPVAKSLQLGATALTVALSLNPVANGAGRIFWGWVSDHIGRERAMFIAFLSQALCLTGVVTLGRIGEIWFVVLIALVFFTWGEIYVLFPSAIAEFFGARHATSNYSFLYSTKAFASIMAGGLAAALFETTGSWNAGFYGSSILALCSALMALGLRKMPRPVQQSYVPAPTPVER